MTRPPVQTLLPSTQPPGPLLLTCEHASAGLPDWLSLGPGDAAWMETHWALDLGARALTVALSRHLSSPAVLANFSRLVCDPNRSPGDPTWIRPSVEGHALGFNQHLDADERARRARELYAPYHACIDHLLSERLARGQPTFLFSVHTYTPDYMGERRDMEAGVLFDLHDELGAFLADALSAGGLHTEINQPWSGKQGLAYSPDRHGRAHRVPYLEIEIRHDLLASPEGVERIAALLAPPLRALANR